MGNPTPKFRIIAGPCVIESEQLALQIATSLKALSQNWDADFYFKASFDKANRTSLKSFRGPGIKEGLSILGRLRTQLGIKTLTDVHEVSHVEPSVDTVDAIQIPAFLCRQTDLVVAAARLCAKTGRQLNIKKGQFLAPNDSRHIIEKVREAATNEAWIESSFSITERGSCFGYNNLVVDMAAIPIIKQFGVRVIYDATHSVQTPSSADGTTGAKRNAIEPLAMAAIAAGADGIFFECHPDPTTAKSDGSNSIYLDDVGPFVRKLMGLRNFILDQPQATLRGEIHA